jgi:molybdate transport system ATP-binding protein
METGAGSEPRSRREGDHVATCYDPGGMTSPAYVEIESATFRGPRGPLFAGCSLVIAPGQRWAVVGGNGSGKGLLLSALMGRLPLLAGRLRHPFLEGDARFADSVFGVLPPGSIALASMREHRQWLLARDFHQLRWHGSLAGERATVADLLDRRLVEQRHPFAVLDPAGDAQYAVARQREIARFALDPLLPRPVVALSNGELHRFVLARALLRQPRLLLVEDPLAGLDGPSRTRLLDILDGLAAEGIGLVVATLRDDELPSGITHVARVAAGQILGVGPRTHHPPLTRADPPRIRVPADLPRATDDDSPILELCAVSVQHGPVTLLDQVSLRVARGEHWALLGPNGSGKSTLLSLVLADHPQVYANDVRVAGLRLGPGRSIWEQKAQCGWLSPELEAHYPPDARLLEVVLSGFAATLGMHRQPSAAEATAARGCLAGFGLDDQAETRFADSPPQTRRLALLARAAVHRPALLLLDEPCQGLDAASRATLLAALTTTLAALGAAMIYVTHDVDEIPASVTKLLVLDRGRVHYAGPRTAWRP